MMQYPFLYALIALDVKEFSRKKIHMKDQNGLYYYPNPAETSTRVYVRNGTSGPEFRLWRQDMPEVWEKHGWLPMGVIEAAAKMYTASPGSADPMLLYDKAVAEALIRDDSRSKN